MNRTLSTSAVSIKKRLIPKHCKSICLATTCIARMMWWRILFYGIIFNFICMLMIKEIFKAIQIDIVIGRCFRKLHYPFVAGLELNEEK